MRLNNDENLNKLTSDAPKKSHSDANSRKLDLMRGDIRRICESFEISTEKYKPEKTLELVRRFMASESGVFRVLYSEIHRCLMELDADERKGVFCTNAEALLQNVFEEENCSRDEIKIILKIYDHIQLVNAQIISVENTIAPHVEGVKSKFRDEIKEVEREYVTILGIFAATVLAFVGTFTFSTSVFNNVGTTPFWKIFVMSGVIGVVFHQIISLLIDFLRDINGKSRPKSNTKRICVFMFVIFLIFTAGMLLGINFESGIKNMILNFLSKT